MGGRGSASGGQGAGEFGNITVTGSQSNVTAALQEILGEGATLNDVAELTGADPEGAEVTVKVENGALVVTVRTKDYTMSRSIRLEGWKLVIDNDSFYVKNPGKGLGARIFAQQVARARRKGVERIEVQAARSDTENGYYTWARLGYKLDVRRSLRAEAERAGFGNVTNTHELFSKKGGAAWWKEHGTTAFGSFDLSRNSTSSKILRAYSKERGIRVKGL